MKIQNIGKEYLSCFFKYILSIFTAVSIISVSTIIALNLKFIYKLIIYKYNLIDITGVSAENLMKEYGGLINYLQNPFIKSLKFENFIMSPYGEMHFYEVKRIFIILIIIGIMFLIINLIYFIIGRVKNNRIYIIKITKNLNSGSNILIGFFIVLIGVYFIDFSKAFIIFHKIFFRNDYWIFDERIDPIIKALPEDLFMIYGAVILGIIILIATAIKTVNRRVIMREEN